MSNELYGAGAPAWASGEPNQNHGLNSRYNSSSYQKGGNDDNYQPPSVGGTYAQQQTQITEDSLKTQYQAEGTANTVLAQMTTQRYQLQGAHDNVADMTQTAELAKKELEELRKKTLKKKRKLQTIIAILGAIDTLLFLRLLICGGSFFC